MLQAHEGETFYTAKRSAVPLPDPRQGAVCEPQKASPSPFPPLPMPWPASRAREAAGEAITGPKKIGCYGASYLYPVFLQLGIIHLPQTNDEPLQ